MSLKPEPVEAWPNQTAFDRLRLHYFKVLIYKNGRKFTAVSIALTTNSTCDFSGFNHRGC